MSQRKRKRRIQKRYFESLPIFLQRTLRQCEAIYERRFGALPKKPTTDAGGEG